MDGNRFDTITRRLTSVASRRHVLSGLGVATVGALVGREASAAPSPVVACRKLCNAEAKETRKGCKGPHGKGNNSKGKNECLKRARDERAACFDTCLVSEG
jgi:hypothetical protein